MWFLGALLGLIVGGVIDEWEGALAGATLGAFVGAILSAARKAAAGNPELVSRVASLEAQMTKLAYGFELAKQRIAALERGAPTPAESPEPVIPPVAEVVATVTASAPEAPVAATPAEPEPVAAPEAPASVEEPQDAPEPAERPFWWKWLFGGNTLVRAGIAILFVGVAFLVKYAAEHAHFPVELRLACIAAGGIVMLVIGWRLRDKRAGYALSMQGGGIGILYLTVFAALRLYSMLPPAMAFALLVVVVVASALLAVWQDAMALALIGTAGGFLAPVLTSTGQGSHVALFSYYMLLNLGIFGIAWVKAWRPLNVAGFLFTFVISALWGWKSYSQEFFGTTEPFLIAFFLLYVGIALLYALRRSIEVTHYVDGTLVFGVPIVAFGLQSQLVRDMDYGLAFSALALGAFYIVLARALWSRRAQGLTLLTESFLALGVVFATLALPLALDGKWTSAAWALEGAAVVWIGGKQNRKLAQWFGILLQFAAGIAFIASAGGPVHVQRGGYTASADDFGTGRPWPVLNGDYLGCVFIALAGWFCGYCVHRRGEKLATLAAPVSGLLFIWALLWWTAAGCLELERYVDHTYLVNADIAFFAASALVFCLVHPRLQWKMVSVPQALLLPVLYLLALTTIVQAPHAFANFGWVAWPLAIAVVYWILRRREDEFGNFVGDATHACALWLVTGLACWEVGYGIDRAVAGSGIWPYVAWAIVPGLVLAAISRYGKYIAWPVAPRLALYMTVCAAPILVYLYIWAIWVNVVSDGDPSPLVYVPLINPLDIATFLILLALTLWYVRLRMYSIARAPEPRTAGAAIGAAAFIWLTASLLRTLHYWAGIPFDHTAMFHSMLAQASLSVFWTVLACGLMLFATRRGLRTLWMVGGALLIVVVVKLFLFDLAEISGIARIVSFIGVGVMLLAIGYFSPVPPRRAADQT